MMHTLYESIVVKLLKNISNNAKKEFDKIWLTQKIPSCFKKSPRSIELLENYKAVENYLVFHYYLTLFKNTSIDYYYYSQLIEFRNLLENLYENKRIEETEMRLTSWLEWFENYFGIQNTTEHYHFISHLVQNTKLHGPIPMNTLSMYENFNKFINTSIVSKNSFLHSMRFFDMKSIIESSFCKLKGK